jgi:hypothetical protein
MLNLLIAIFCGEYENIEENGKAVKTMEKAILHKYEADVGLC